MALRIKRRTTGASGPPATLAAGELAFNEVDNTLYYGRGMGPDGRLAAEVIAIGIGIPSPGGGGGGGGGGGTQLTIDDTTVTIDSTTDTITG